MHTHLPRLVYALHDGSEGATRHVIGVEAVDQHGCEQASCPSSATVFEVRNILVKRSREGQHGGGALGLGIVMERNALAVLNPVARATLSTRARKFGASRIAALMAEAGLCPSILPLEDAKSTGGGGIVLVPFRDLDLGRNGLALCGHLRLQL